MPEPSIHVSVIAPLTPAIQRVKQLLFSPFDLGTWFVLGFCVWLAELGQFRGGGGTGFRFGDHRGASLEEIFTRARDYVMDNLGWIIPLASVLFLIGVAVWLVLTWISSRGQFMLVHDVVHRRAEIAVPWTQYSSHADSLFVFRVILGLIGFGLMLPFAAAMIWMLSQWAAPVERTPLPIVAVVMTALMWMGLALLLAVVRKLTLDFVVPIMYLGTTSSLEGWRRLGALIAAYPGPLLLYLLFSIVLSIGIGIIVLAAVLVTCCLAGCLIAIPYVGTVVLLPISIFRRSYSLEYLAQFGPEFHTLRL